MNGIITSKRRLILCMSVSLFLTMTTVFGYQIEHYSEVFLDWIVLGLIFLLFIGISTLLLAVYKVFDKVKKTTDEEKLINGWKIYVISLLCLLGLYAINFLAVYPGLFVFDASWQYWMWTGNEISEHHPVIHTVVLGYIVDTIYQSRGAINHGVAVYTIFQIVISALCISYFIKFVYSKLKNKMVLVMQVLFFGLYPPIVLQVMSATKDTWFFVCMLVVIALTIELIENYETFSKSVLKVFLWILFVTGIIIFRNNCIYAIPFFAVALLKVVKGKKIFISGMLACVVGVLLLYKLIFVPAFVTVEIDGREMYSVPAQQMMRIYNNDKADISKEEREMVDRLFIKDESEYYHPKIADLAKGNLDMMYYKANSAQINKLYITLMAKNFKMAIESFLENTCGFWYPGCELTLYKDGTKGYWVVDCYDPVVSNPKIKFIYDFYKLFEDSNFVTKNPITSLLFSPGVFFYLFVIMFAYAIDRKMMVYLPVFVLLFALWLTYLLGPVALVRYVIWLFGIVPLYFVMVYEKEENIGFYKKI